MKSSPVPSWIQLTKHNNPAADMAMQKMLMQDPCPGTNRLVTCKEEHHGTMHIDKQHTDAPRRRERENLLLSGPTSQQGVETGRIPVPALETTINNAKVPLLTPEWTTQSLLTNCDHPIGLECSDASDFSEPLAS